MAIREGHAQREGARARHDEHSGNHRPHLCAVLAPPVERGTHGDQQHGDREPARHGIDHAWHRRPLAHSRLFGPELLQAAFAESAHHFQFDHRTPLATTGLDGIAYVLTHG